MTKVIAMKLEALQRLQKKKNKAGLHLTKNLPNPKIYKKV